MPRAINLFHVLGNVKMGVHEESLKVCITSIEELYTFVQILMTLAHFQGHGLDGKNRSKLTFSSFKCEMIEHLLSVHKHRGASAKGSLNLKLLKSLNLKLIPDQNVNLKVYKKGHMLCAFQFEIYYTKMELRPLNNKTKHQSYELENACSCSADHIQETRGCSCHSRGCGVA